MSRNRQDALASDVFGSPVYVLDGEVFLGTGPDRIARRCVEVRPLTLIAHRP